MADTITVDQLRRLLDEGEPVNVLDIRAPEDFAEWAVPDSVNIEAIDALYEGDATPLAAFEPAGPGPVVTVCPRGRTSLLAAEALRARGIEALSLEGGLAAWSLAWNTADVPLDGGAKIVQVRRTGKGCLSYLVASRGAAVVIDPSVEPSVYEAIAQERGWRIIGVAETHVHADHLSRARRLATATGARLLLPDQDRVAFEHEPVGDGARIAVGDAELEVVATPGHTDESVTLRLGDAALFTGDTLFLDAVGRPDLETDEAGRKRRAAALHGSLQDLAKLAPGLLVLPAHTDRPVPFDGVPLARPLGEVVASIALLAVPRDAFVERLTAKVRATPPNHEEIVRLNEAGTWPEGDPGELEAGANRCAAG